MKQWIAGLVLAGILMPFFAAQVHAQTIYSNPHKATAQRVSAPQNGKDFGIWAPRVAIFKDYFAHDLLRGAAKGFDDGIHLSTYNYRQWTEDDLQKLATSFNGVDMFSGLMYMKNSAGIKDANGNYTAAAIQAQNALTELKPDCCKSWKSFFNMIVRVEEANKNAIIPLLKRRHLDIPPGYGSLLQ